MIDVDDIFQQLASSKKLERDKGLAELHDVLTRADPDEYQQLTAYFADKASHASFSAEANENESKPRWELIHGTITGLKVLVSHPWSYSDFCDMVLDTASLCLSHEEYRIRIAGGECFGELCRRLGASVYVKIKANILAGIHDNLERDTFQDEKESLTESLEEGEVEMSSSPRTSALMMHERLSNFNSGTKKIFHDTAGWKNLETWMKCLQSVIDGCGVQFNAQIDQELLDLIFTSLNHTNRFVRETGFQVCGSIVSCNSQVQDSMNRPSKEHDSIEIFGMQFAEHLASGLADNWSQVRLAASVATRSFFRALDTESRVEYMPLLLPRMCLNRYYVAEGVRIYSQETWKDVTDGHGRELVEQHISPTIDFYVSQSQADNHAVREAACTCIAELGTKISKDCVRPSVTRLLDTLVTCFEDDSWPVRDAACIASGSFVVGFPEESRGYLTALMPLFCENLQDNIPSVRGGAAAALADVAKTYGSEVADDLLSMIESSLKDVTNQPANTDKYSGLEKGPATYSVVKRARDNDADLHSNKTMYSCGSLAPKMGRGKPKDKGGCMHSTFRRPAELWEKAEGCIHLMAELSSQASVHQQISNQLPLLASAAAHHHYTQHIALLETVCKRLPEIAKNIGKRLFKPHLELFFDAVFYSLSCDNALTSSAASQCLNSLANFLGPNILRGRVEIYNPSLMGQLEANIMIAPM